MVGPTWTWKKLQGSLEHPSSLGRISWLGRKRLNSQKTRSRAPAVLWHTVLGVSFCFRCLLCGFLEEDGFVHLSVPRSEKAHLCRNLFNTELMNGCPSLWYTKWSCMNFSCLVCMCSMKMMIVCLACSFMSHQTLSFGLFLCKIRASLFYGHSYFYRWLCIESKTTGKHT